MGDEMTVSSQLGRGTTFKFRYYCQRSGCPWHRSQTANVPNHCPRTQATPLSDSDTGW